MVSGKPVIACLLVYKRRPLQPSVVMDLSYPSASFHSILFTSIQQLGSPLDSLIFFSYLKKTQFIHHHGPISPDLSSAIG